MTEGVRSPSPHHPKRLGWSPHEMKRPVLFMAEIGQERVTTGSGLGHLVTYPAGVCTSPSLCVPVSLEKQSRLG